MESYTSRFPLSRAVLALGSVQVSPVHCSGFLRYPFAFCSHSTAAEVHLSVPCLILLIKAIAERACVSLFFRNLSGVWLQACLGSAWSVIAAELSIG